MQQKKKTEKQLVKHKHEIFKKNATRTSRCWQSSIPKTKNSFPSKLSLCSYSKAGSNNKTKFKKTCDQKLCIYHTPLPVAIIISQASYFYILYNVMLVRSKSIDKIVLLILAVQEESESMQSSIFITTWLDQYRLGGLP